MINALLYTARVTTASVTILVYSLLLGTTRYHALLLYFIKNIYTKFIRKEW